MIENTVNNWLRIAFQQPLDCESEVFNLINDISLYYTSEEIQQHSKRLKAIQRKKNSILLIPRHGIIQEPQVLLKYIAEFLIQNRIDIKSCSIFEIYQKEPIVKKKSVKKPWWKFF
jgi:hypothetical protein